MTSPGLLAFALLVAVAACAHAPPAGLSREPGGLLSEVREAQARVQRVRGTARVRVESPGIKGTVLELVAAEKPDRLRLETLDFFGNPAAVLVASAGRFTFLDAKEGVLYRGEATPENVSRLLPVVLPLEELVTVLCGSAPLLDGPPLEVGVDGSHLLVTLGRGELGQRLWVGEGAAVVESRIRRAGGEPGDRPAYDLAFDDFASQGGVRFPRALRLSAPSARSDVQLRWKADLEVNGALEARAFEPPAARGARVVELGRGEAIPQGPLAPGG